MTGMRRSQSFSNTQFDVFVAVIPTSYCGKKTPQTNFNYGPFMMTPSNGNIFRVIVPLLEVSTGLRWIPFTKASDAELWYFLRPGSKQMVEQIARYVADLRRHRAHYDVSVMLTPSSIDERPLQYVQQLRQIIPSRGSGGRSRTFNVKIIFAIAQFVKFVGIQLASILRREPYPNTTKYAKPIAYLWDRLFCGREIALVITESNSMHRHYSWCYFTYCNWFNQLRMPTSLNQWILMETFDRSDPSSYWITVFNCLKSIHIIALVALKDISLFVIIIYKSSILSFGLEIEVRAWIIHADVLLMTISNAFFESKCMYFDPSFIEICFTWSN